MTKDQQQRIAAQIKAWRDIGQGEHADALRRQMIALLSPFWRKQ